VAFICRFDCIEQSVFILINLNNNKKLHFRETNVSNADKRYRQEFEGGPTTNNTKMEVKPVIHNNRNQIVNRNHNSGNTGKETIYFLR